MTRDDIIRLAREAGLTLSSFCRWSAYSDDLERFAALVAAAEREACARMVDHILKEGGGTYGKAIRARGEEQPYATQAAMVESQTHGRMQIDPATGNVSIGAIRARGET